MLDLNVYKQVKIKDSVTVLVTMALNTVILSLTLSYSGIFLM